MIYYCNQAAFLHGNALLRYWAAFIAMQGSQRGLVWSSIMEYVSFSWSVTVQNPLL